MRALKLWLSVQVFGLDAFRDAVAHGIALAEHAEAVLRARAGLGGRHARAARDRLLRTRGRRRLADLGRDRARRLRRALDDRAPRPTVLRLCTINPRTTFEEIEATIERMERV